MVAYFHGSQPQKCENRPYLKNKVPIIGISQKLAWKFSLTTETLRKKDRTIETFLAGKMTSLLFYVTSFSTFSNEDASAGTIYLKIGTVVYFAFKSQKISFRPVA